MKRNGFNFDLSKEVIDRVTLWILALGLLIAVTFSVAKSAVKDYQELQDQLHNRPSIQATNSGATR
jgi:hypothetical protein